MGLGLVKFLTKNPNLKFNNFRGWGDGVGGLGEG